MQKNDMTKFSRLMMNLGEIYGKAVSDTFTELYWQFLKNFSYDEVTQAVQACVGNPDTGQYFPKPADILRYIQGNSEAQAMQAWSKVLNAAKRIGRYRGVIFDDPLIHAAINEMGGWVIVCNINQTNLEQRAREFCKRYQHLKLRPPEKVPRYLPGLGTQAVVIVDDHVSSKLKIEKNNSDQEQ